MNDQLDSGQWYKLCGALNIIADNEELVRLNNAYRQAHRHYHNVQHIQECLELYHRYSQLTDSYSPLAECALWYHDAVYNPRATDNEKRSALWAKAYLAKSGVESRANELVYSLIMATCHGAVPDEALHQTVVDVDLSILGSDPLRYRQYSQQIREEYKWVPGFIYTGKRKKLLQSFLKRRQIYCTTWFAEQFESRARENIESEISRLT